MDSSRICGAIQDAARPCSRHHSVLEYNLSVDEDRGHTLRVLVWLLEGRHIADGFRIEDDDVGFHSRTENAAIGKPDALCRVRGHLANRVFERENLDVAHVSAEDAGE